jgi:riboflavin synthase
MFTGIIQNQAKVIQKKSAGGPIRFAFRFLKAEKRKIESGESIAVDGVCLTAAKVLPNGFEADAVRETLAATTLSRLEKNSVVNTERALRYGDPLGGHFVTGHVDARSRILNIETRGKNRLYTFGLPPSLAVFIAPKGSVVVDGISLTVQTVKGAVFQIAIVPHTWRVTTLGRKKKGDEVNLEIDLIARYLNRLQDVMGGSGKSAKKSITKSKLSQQGF